MWFSLNSSIVCIFIVCSGCRLNDLDFSDTSWWFCQAGNHSISKRISRFRDRGAAWLSSLVGFVQEPERSCFMFDVVPLCDCMKWYAFMLRPIHSISKFDKCRIDIAPAGLTIEATSCSTTQRFRSAWCCLGCCPCVAWRSLCQRVASRTRKVIEWLGMARQGFKNKAVSFWNTLCISL